MDTFTPLVTTREATKDEYDRVLELTNELYNSIELENENNDWHQPAIEWLEQATSQGTATAVVAYDSATEKIVASGIGIVYNDIPQPWLPNGKMGYIRWMSTEEDFRGYGVGEKVLNALMKWFEEKEITRVQLHASDKAVEFYKQHGFVDTSYQNLWWRKK